MEQDNAMMQMILKGKGVKVLLPIAVMLLEVHQYKEEILNFTPPIQNILYQRKGKYWNLKSMEMKKTKGD